MANDAHDGAKAARNAAAGKRYAAFISYSHADEEFGDWLHEKLENYQVPSALVGRKGPDGPIKKRLGKVFRDRSDLSAAHDLGLEIREGLERADALIVLCSPRSCGSKYVNEEIRTFKQLGKGQRILAAIVDGEPHAAGKPNCTAADECFPHALIYRLDVEGALSAAPEPVEPTAADFRAGKDGRENGSLKLIAGLLGVDLDELIQRERVAERRRRHTAYGIALAMLALACTAVGLGIIAQRSEQRAHAAQMQAFNERSWEAMARGEDALAARYAVASAGLALQGEALDQRHPLSALNAITNRAQRSVVVFRGNAGQVVAATPMATGIRLAVRNEDLSIRVVNSTQPGVSVNVPEFDGEPVTAAALSPDGALLATFVGTRARIWTASGRPHLTLPLDGHTDIILGISFSADGTRVVTASADRTARVWSAADGHLIAEFEGHDRPVVAAAFSADGRFIVTSSGDNDARIWEVVSQRNVVLHGHQGDVLNAHFSADGRRVVTASRDETARVWDAASGALIVPLVGHRDDVLSARFDPEGKWVVTASDDGTAKVWDVQVQEGRTTSGHLIQTLVGHNDAVVDAIFSADGTRIFTYSNDGTVRDWPAVDARLTQCLRHGRDVRAARFGVADEVVTADRDGDVQVWPLTTDSRTNLSACLTAGAGTGGLHSQPQRLHHDDVRDVAFSSDGARAVTAAYDSTAVIWSVRDHQRWRQEGAPLDHHPFDRVLTAQFSPDGRMVLTTGKKKEDHEDGVAMLWDAQSRRRAQTMSYPSGGAVWAARFDRNGANLATAHNNGDVLIWRRRDDGVYARAPFVLRGGGGRVRVLSFSPDGSHLVTGSEDGVARIWNLCAHRIGEDRCSPSVVRSLRGHDGPIRSVAYSNDSAGALVATGSQDNSARVWSTASGRTIAVFALHDGDVQSVAFDRTSMRLLTASDDNLALVWDVSGLWTPLSGLRREACDRLLLPGDDAFTGDEVTADPLIPEIWPGAGDHSVCGSPWRRG